ncbi:hypothetical protein TraAM80_10353 [Trypanosoma rangeli]|uniref:Uncharacterized protein n=1 Tax=Trypanosoma rangeli TaxID=5698 RepID=A0A3R7JTG9_TRYRA|nr:uncharacterized protein TraAM80_10353 [Trypanosoma rangeli]RNE95187.1 hypothetical protein TraAM80_10353 [Trypanosoma rangeli]|eukprot:RNE95187.1 hypothetical protein TraAM80_10353 [Trypanosoma rangeli]
MRCRDGALRGRAAYKRNAEDCVGLTGWCGGRRVGLPLLLLQRGICCRTLFLLVASGANVPASDNLRVPPPRRPKEAETSAAAFAGCAPCGPVVWQTVPSRNSRAPHHVLGAACICVAGENAASLLLAGERTGAGCSAPSHLGKIAVQIVTATRQSISL